MLRKAGERVVLHDDHFLPTTKDEEWLEQVGKNGWIVLTKDKRIKKRSHEYQILYAFHVAAFIFSSGNATGSQVAQAFKKALPAIKRTLKKHPKPFIANVALGGSVSLYEKNTR